MGFWGFLTLNIPLILFVMVMLFLRVIISGLIEGELQSLHLNYEMILIVFVGLIFFWH